MQNLEIKDLHVAVENKEIINGLNLTIKPGEVHALMGPNGSGKSTLSYAIMGHPKYKVTKGDILVYGKSILDLPVNERAKLGIFLGFQHPQEVAGVGISSFLRTVLAGQKKSVAEQSSAKAAAQQIPSVPEFYKLLKQKMHAIGLSEDFLKRGLNQGFSGGEKKRLEVLQLAIIKPKFAILDEPDSGTDVDAIKTIAAAINRVREAGILIITHHNKILDYIVPDFVHVIVGGRIVKSGRAELAGQIEKTGYDSFKAAEVTA
ncbi:MAG: Fe-S cluster assembly ATPase SufC [DPANN group archaeon]|nr:Fe-S cluster assembly ATPase SufC [DPANN group archaeon]